MRQIQFAAPRSQGSKLRSLLSEHESNAIREWSTLDHVFIDANVPNRRVGALLADATDVDQVTLTISTGDVLTITAEDGVSETINDVTGSSPALVFMAARHSMGGWIGSLGYAAAAGAIVWIGLFVGSVPLLIGAMLIAPFAGPAMNAAIATAVGHSSHLFSSLRRYVATLAVTILTAGLLHAIFGGRIVTTTMSSTANISLLAVLIPLAGGAAGALNLMQSERSSLVSAAATGVLVAAALAPPAGLVGMASVAGEWDLCVSAMFLLALQLAAINLSGSIVFALHKVSPSSDGLSPGRSAVRTISLAASVLVVAALFVVQVSASPNLQRASVEQSAVSDATSVVDETDGVDSVDFSARFTRSSINGQRTLLVVGFVQVPPSTDIDATSSLLTTQVADAIEERHDVTALVEITVFTADRSD